MMKPGHQYFAFCTSLWLPASWVFVTGADAVGAADTAGGDADPGFWAGGTYVSPPGPQPGIVNGISMTDNAAPTTGTVTLSNHNFWVWTAASKIRFPTDGVVVWD